MRLLLDTNAVIEQLSNFSLPVPTLAYDYGISVITEAELLRLAGIGTEEQTHIERILSTFHIYPVDSRIARRAAMIGRTRKTKLPDLLIAATAIELGVTLVSRNSKDFVKIPGLKVRASI